MRFRVASLFVGVLLAATLAASVSPRALQLQRKSSAQDEALVEVRAESRLQVLPAIILEVVIPILIHLVTAAISEAIYGKHGSCASMYMPDLSTSAASNSQLADELLMWCEKSPVTWDPASGASGEKYYEVHGRGGGMFLLGECKFRFDWAPKPGGIHYDCTAAKVRTKIIGDGKPLSVFNDLYNKYPKTHFTFHIEGVNVQVTNCESNYQKSYVRTYVAMPKPYWFTSKVNTLNVQEGEATDYFNNPYVFIVLEGWTQGDCSGDKSPGVVWSFPYKVDINNGFISKAWVMPSDPNAPHRPSFTEPMYYPMVGSSGYQQATPVVDYAEQTDGQCSRFALCKD